MTLPFEDLNRIFKELSRKDLHSCSLVNRTWSLVALPMLWRNFPLYTVKTISTLISCLSEQAKDDLKKMGIRLENWMKLGSSIDYPSYMSSLDYSTLLRNVHCLLSKQINQEQQLKCLMYHLMEYLCKLLMNRCVNLVNLEFNHITLIEANYILIIPFYHFPGANDSLINITSLTLDCKLTYSDQFFYALSGVCKRVKKLSLLHSKDSNSLIYFITSLDHLEELYIGDSSAFFQAKSTSEQLEQQAQSLKGLELHYSSVSKSFLSQCINLKVLTIYGDYFFRNIESLNDIELIKLEEICIDEVNEVSKNKITKLLLNTKDILKRISLKGDFNQSIDLTKAIVYNCANLVYFNGIFDDSLTGLLATFVQNCPFLEIFEVYNNDLDDDSTNIKISVELKRLGDIITGNLKKLRLKESWIYDIDSLDYFMKSCFEKLKGRFEFYINLKKLDNMQNYYGKKVLFKDYCKGLMHVELIC
ncbi:19217_t:CDS:1 [Funneliformis geosporum]|uniref:6540_t:CDS:1 n=1 Tax=Funneliformis geosporum TaxID=1117311 RepID=A0A9W4SUR0_9GLOM|nr:6540_t:CDS:1 [Funneliformis geosporum]CAI2186406.1 19217_t:CDS:1 [Funneliformis geosporum]